LLLNRWNVKVFKIYVTFVVAKDEDWKATWNPTLDCKSCKHFFLNYFHECYVFRFYRWEGYAPLFCVVPSDGSWS